jgi:hypothetical protein
VWFALPPCSVAVPQQSQAASVDFESNNIQKNRTHEEALHHPTPLARKLKITEPTTKHYTTPSHWSEKLKESNP